DGDTVTVWYTVTGVKSASTLYNVMHSGDDISDTVPVAVEATGNNGTLLQQVDYYKLASLTIKIPVYRGMVSGDTVTVYWIGRDYTYDSDTITVSAIGEIDVLVPRMEFIDTIGDTAFVYFSVKKNGVGDEISSSILYLDIEGQSLELKSPDVSDDLQTVTVIYSGMSSSDRVKVRVVGASINETSVQQGNDSNIIIFSIDRSWLEKDERSNLLYNYAVGVSGGEYQFSRVTRISAT
ncbi:hypothetical protein NG99_10855, partial [Erwinia typographi]